MKSIILIFVLMFSSLGLAEIDLRYIPVQDSGRIKPFDSFAKEALQLVYGRRSFKKREATEVVLTWMIIPETWLKEPFIQIQHAGLKESLQLDKMRIHFSPEELMQNDKMALYIRELVTKRQSKEKLDPFFSAVQRLDNQLTMFHAIRLGEAIRPVPPQEGSAESTWRSLGQSPDPLKSSFLAITKALVEIAVAEAEPSTANPGKSVEKIRENMNAEVARFIDLARKENPKLYEVDAKIKAEVFYNSLHPFRYGWIFYLLGFLFLLAHLFGAPSWTYRTSWGAILFGFLIHTFGFALRIYIMGRPPVSNMYETVIWVPWGAVLFSMIFDRVLKSKVTLAAACMVATLCMIVADLAPAILDSSLQPLEPVLRDNFWLTTHVLMITISYGAFFLALMLGNIVLACYLISEKKYRSLISGGVEAIYRCLQIGVVLLAAGIILGGVWAEYSWGRFWGWDPKETWALIALLGYLALLHARLVGAVRDFGMAAGSIVAFSLVIMAWYGVNFWLGAGLHSYGFGAGGGEGVAAFVGVHFLYVIYVAIVRHNQKSSAA